MALRKVQKEMAITLFAKAFSATEDEKNRKELFIQFSDAYEDSIQDWQCKVEEELKDDAVKEEFQRLVNREHNKDIKDIVIIENLKKEDLEQISYLACKELDMMPWVENEMGPESLLDFIDSGYSYVAKRENVILGFILAYKCPAYGGHYYMYIDTFVVNSDVQGKGIGKMLLQKLRENMFRNRIYRIKLMTKKEMPAYKIYKHLGFEEVENYVHMQRY